MKTLHEKLHHIQQNLNAPKDAWNAFAKYKYRSAESILAAVKPLLNETGLILTLSDKMEAVGNRVYVTTTATITDGANSIHSTASAREPENKKGADDSQITGAASSYARKYALCGLFAIDDNKDADATNTHQEQPQPAGIDVKKAIAELKKAQNLEELQAVFGKQWKLANNAQRAAIKEVYESMKADFIAAQQG